MNRKNHFVFDKPVKGRGFMVPHYSKRAHRFMRVAARPYLSLFEGVSQVIAVNAEKLIDAFIEDKEGGRRLIIAFRHPSKHDAPVLTWALNKSLPALAAQQGRKLKFIPHARFLYGKDVLNWAGFMSVWLFPRIGHIPVENRGVNREGMDLLRKELVSGEFPLALAPEGQVSYHQYKCYPVESGIGSLARWTMEGGRDVQIIPVSTQYKFSDDEPAFIDLILGKWSLLTGITLKQSGSSTEQLYLCLLEATHFTVNLLEKEFYISPDRGLNNDYSPEALAERLAVLNDAVLRAGERIFGFKPEGEILDRVFRLRNEAVGRFYPDHLEPLEQSLIEKDQLAYKSLEARIVDRFQQIVDVMEYLDPFYISPDGRLDRMCEYAQSLLDILNRMQGGNINSRYLPLGKKVKLHVGKAVNTDDIKLNFPAGRDFQSEVTQAVYRSLSELSVGLPEF